MSLLKESQHLQIPLEEIESGTKNFQDCIGKGGFGMVYKGQLCISGKPTTVAIKRLSEQFGQGLKEFLTEIQLLTRQAHPNLISLVGYCDDGKEKIIVYEYAAHGSLDQYIRRSKNRNSISNLTWLEKLKICVGAARGLDYLHNHVGKHQTVIHRDIKSSNILIDENWDAKISDLGLSKLSLSGLNRSTVVSHACGTPGYIEPEYMYTGTVKKESDVYSFGMVLFEVLCGRLCTVRDDDGFLLSGPLAIDYYERNKLDEIMDPSLKEHMSPDSMNKFSSIAYRCLHYDREQRPSMDVVLKELEESVQIQVITLSHALEASPSYALEDPHKSSGEFGVAVNKESTIASSEPPVIMPLKKENQLHISVEISPHEVAYRSSVDFQSSSDITMETQPNNDVNVRVVETRAMSLDTLQETTDQPWLESNQETVNGILESKKHIWKHQELSELVEDYFEHSRQAFNFYDALEKCLKRVQDFRMLIFVAINHFEEKRYVKTLEKLENLKVIGDPFSRDFYNNFQFVYMQQSALLEKVKQNKRKLNNKVKHIQTRRKACNVAFLVTFSAALIISVMMVVQGVSVISMVLPSAATISLAIIGIWMNSSLKKYRNAMRGEEELISSMRVGCSMGVKDLDNIRVLVDKMEKGMEDLINKSALFTIKGDKEVVLNWIIKEMKKMLDLFVYNLESLETSARNYFSEFRSCRESLISQLNNGT